MDVDIQQYDYYSYNSYCFLVKATYTNVENNPSARRYRRAVGFVTQEKSLTFVYKEEGVFLHAGNTPSFVLLSKFKKKRFIFA